MMANWRYHAKPFTAWRKRWSLNSDPTQVLDGIIPTAQLDKHYPDETLDLFGMLVQNVHTGANPAYSSCTLQAGDKECLVHEVTAYHDVVLDYVGWKYHLLTCHPSYIPWSANLYGSFYAWLQTRLKLNQDLQLPAAFGVGGEAAALQTISVSGVPVTCLGKTLTLPRLLVDVGLGSTMLTGQNLTFWNYQDPPLRLKPYQRLMVQSAQNQAGIGAITGAVLSVNFIWSEREFSADVG